MLTVDVAELLMDSSLSDFRALARDLDHVGRLLLIKLRNFLSGGDLAQQRESYRRTVTTGIDDTVAESELFLRCLQKHYKHPRDHVATANVPPPYNHETIIQCLSSQEPACKRDATNLTDFHRDVVVLGCRPHSDTGHGWILLWQAIFSWGETTT